MKLFERVYLCVEPCMPVLQRLARKRLLELIRAHSGDVPWKILDVGGRRSPYTIGLPATVTVTDLERCSPVQARLGLGVTAEMAQNLRARRSNVSQVLVDDMTRSTLPTSAFDCVVCVEVLEHVEQDRQFVTEVARVLRPGGYFLLTTPNGDHVPNRNPDHKRHYRGEQLRALLAECLEVISVEYAVRDGRFYTWGLQSWSLRHPRRTVASAIGNLINGIQSAAANVKAQSAATQHLVALCRKRPSSHTV